MNVQGYLANIGIWNEEINLDVATLKRLQHKHLLRIPFENLDIHWKRPIVLDVERLYKKIIGDDQQLGTNRGGFCYELNGLFGALLNELAFPTRMVSARVAMGDKGFSREYDHMALISTVGEEEYLVDVGFGAFTTEPPRMVLDVEQDDPSGSYVIREHDDGYLVVLKEGVPEYIFKPIARELAEFAEMCEFHQTSPESHFTQGKVCSILTETGRETLTDKKVIFTENGEKDESEIGSEKDFYEALAWIFKIWRPAD